MPRLALSLPAELGSVQGDAPGEVGDWRSAVERQPIGPSGSDDGNSGTTQIESWLACWSDGWRVAENGDDVTSSR